MSPKTDISAEEMARYVENEVTQGRAREIEEHLQGCESCRERLRHAQALVAALEDVEIPAEDDLVERLQRLTRELPDAAHPLRSPRRAWLLGASALAAAAVVVMAVVNTGDDSDAFRHKSASAYRADDWVALKLYQVDQGQEARLLGPTMPAGAAIAVAYTNIAPQPFSHLAVLAVDQSREVYWYYPEHNDPALDPLSIEIEYGANVELREMVQHDFPAGPVTIYGLFSRRPLRVSEVEAVIARQPPDAASKRLDLQGSAQYIQQVVVADP